VTANPKKKKFPPLNEVADLVFPTKKTSSVFPPLRKQSNAEM